MFTYIKPLIVIAFFSVASMFGQSYSSSFEKEIFESYKKDSIHYNFFKSMFAIDSLTKESTVLKYQEKVASLIKTFPEKETKERKEQKRVKYIYDKLHNTFFKKYHLNAYFNNLFEDGTYNCVTASALYAYAFDQLQIPYHVKETPSHVFLIAYPKTYKIYLETTVPGEYGFIIPKEDEVKKIIDELISYKLITQEDVTAKGGVMKFYEDFYYGNEYINKSALIGMQYYNKGLTYLDAGDNNNAINSLTKAKVFFSSPLIKPIIKNIMFDKVNNLEFNSFEDIDFLIELFAVANYPGDYTLGNVESSLYKIIEHDDNDKEFIEASIEKFKSIENEKVRNTTLEFLYEYLAKQAGTNENLDDALKYSNNILQVNPNSKMARRIIEYVCFKKVALSTFNITALNNFEENCATYPFLKENKRYNIVLVHLYGRIALTNIKNKDIDTGNLYLKKLETILDNNDVLNEVSKMLLSEVYVKAGNYYYYKEYYKSSYDIYTKGLSYLPNDSDLNKRAQWSKEEL